jgi:1-pyrroline-5-carboxylate dehydrogenase
LSDGNYKTPAPKNELVRSYDPGSLARVHLKNRLEELYHVRVDVAGVIGGQAVRTGAVRPISCPHEHRHGLGQYHQMGPKEAAQAVVAAGRSRPDWSGMAFEQRASVFLKAAELLAGPWRDTINAATMLAVSKNAHQAEIDAAAELIDFFRFNVHYAEQLLQIQPNSADGVWNRSEYRPLDGFVLAITPFNFTSIAGNLPTAPALMGNTVIWKPAGTAVYPAHFLMQLFKEAGLPDGVINLVPAEGRTVGEQVLAHPDFAGLHFTGSTETFTGLWQAIASHLPRYRRYPRIVGETGGKDFVVMHPSASLEQTVTALVRGAFEYQGQKCSAASRAYIPASLWTGVRDFMHSQLDRIRMGDVRDFSNFLNAVIDRAAFDKIRGYIQHARRSSKARVIAGGGADAREGYFIEPTVILADDPHYRSMVEEIFGPVLSIYVYPDRRFTDTLRICRDSSPYGLTGSLFATDRQAIALATEELRAAAGNFYINDKPTGAVVGQQPFGGSRASGTNDKAGSPFNLMRWTSIRTIKENFLPPTDFAYPFSREP